MTLTQDVAIEQRLDAIERQLDFLITEAEERRRLRESVSELTGDLSPVARQGLESMSRSLARAEERGYVDFAKGGFEIVDKVVTSFDKDDLDSLGDNVVLILETVKEMTQPEIMQMLRSTFVHASEIDETEEPPGLFSLLGRLRDPAARRGLYRLIFLLESLGAVRPEDIEKRKEAQQ
ncbi:MAG: DUF1641 domain-containing protein [Acidimicrobiia bacterium]|jgi:uncharacterized protein YjgD (DUF1641 family)